MKLTDTAIRNAQPADKPYKMSDGGGLYLQVMPSGAKYWHQKYRYLRKEKKLSHGVYPDVTLKMARERREQARRLLADGTDPGAHKQKKKEDAREKAENTFELVAREWHAKKAHTWTTRHAKYVLKRLELNILPWLGGSPISAISAKDILGCLRRIEKRGKLHTAHRTLTTVSQVFRYAVATGKTEFNPCPDLRDALPPEKVEHRPAITDPIKVGELLRAIDSYEGSIVVSCAMRLAPLVFVRPGELRKAEWKDIDLDNAEWRYTITKTDTPHIVPLAEQAIEILNEIRSITGKGEYVFPNGRTAKRPMSDAAINAGMQRMGIEKGEMTAHGFRAMARTLLDEELDIRPDFIEHQLAHAVRDPNGRAYNRTAHLKERKEMMQKWADYLDTLKSGAEIVPIKRLV